MFIFGAVDLSSLFLQRIAGFLYKAELMTCGYSPKISENAAAIVSKRCPTGSPQGVMLFVGQNLLRMTRLHFVRLDQNALW